MSEFKLRGSSGKEYRVFQREINWEFDPSADAVDETKDVVLVVLNDATPVEILYHPGPIKTFFKGRAQPSHVVTKTGAKHYATIRCGSQHQGEEVEADLRDAYDLPT